MTRVRDCSSCQRRSRSWIHTGTTPMCSYVSLAALMPEGRHIDIHHVDALLAEQRVRLDARRRDHVVLEQAVDEDDVGSEQLLAAGDALAQDRAVVDDELQVEVGDAHARVAFARRRLAHVAASPTEAEVAALDRVEQQRPVQLLRDRERERSVALELGEPEARS